MLLAGWTYYGTTLLAAAGFMVVIWVVSLVRKDASIIDPFWGPGFVLVAAIGYLYGGGYDERRMLLLALVGIWGLRLGIYLLWRNLKEAEEDRRYQAFRRKWGERFPMVSLYRIFLFQAALLWFISLPVQVAQRSESPAQLGWLDAVGVALWLVGIFFETVGDWQLARFKANPNNRGKVLDSGLWRYTRHPNYFGDFCIWWGLFLIACSVPWGWATLLSPLLMTVFLMRVSGVTLLEKDLEESKPRYRDYKRKTSAFFPWPPKAN
ncbi:MAG: DUF1295 domain-containing protein [Acidobacteriota bacterium]